MTSNQHPSTPPPEEVELEQILQALERRVLAATKSGGASQTMQGALVANKREIAKAKAKLQALITAARIDEIKRLNKAHAITDHAMAHYIMDRKAELHSTLTNDKIGGEHGDSE